MTKTSFQRVHKEMKYQYFELIHVPFSEGLLVAASRSQLLVVRVACYFVAAPSIIAALVFCWMLFTGKKD